MDWVDLSPKGRFKDAQECEAIDRRLIGGRVYGEPCLESICAGPRMQGFIRLVRIRFSLLRNADFVLHGR